MGERLYKKDKIAQKAYKQMRADYNRNMNLFEYHWQQRDYRRTLVIINRLIKENPEPEYLFLHGKKAVNLIALHQYEEAYNLAFETISKYPSHAYICDEMANIIIECSKHLDFQCAIPSKVPL